MQSNQDNKMKHTIISYTSKFHSRHPLLIPYTESAMIILPSLPPLYLRKKRQVGVNWTCSFKGGNSSASCRGGGYTQLLQYILYTLHNAGGYYIAQILLIHGFMVCRNALAQWGKIVTTSIALCCLYRVYGSCMPFRLYAPLV